jgi:NADPH-dependent glutamate synthase beta subunit-like oxidoreductase
MTQAHGLLRYSIPDFKRSKDIVVLAIGYGSDRLIPSETPALLTVKQGIFQVETEFTGATTLDCGYAAGADVRGADLIVTAVAAGRHAVRAMGDYLQGLGPRTSDQTS